MVFDVCPFGAPVLCLTGVCRSVCFWVSCGGAHAIDVGQGTHCASAAAFNVMHTQDPMLAP